MVGRKYESKRPRTIVRDVNRAIHPGNGQQTITEYKDALFALCWRVMNNSTFGLREHCFISSLYSSIYSSAQKKPSRLCRDPHRYDPAVKPERVYGSIAVAEITQFCSKSSQQTPRSSLMTLITPLPTSHCVRPPRSDLRIFGTPP